MTFLLKLECHLGGKELINEKTIYFFNILKTFFIDYTIHQVYNAEKRAKRINVLSKSYESTFGMEKAPKHPIRNFELIEIKNVAKK